MENKHQRTQQCSSFQQYSSTQASAQHLLLQHQLRQAQQAQQQAQQAHQYLPPSLVAAANNKHHLANVVRDAPLSQPQTSSTSSTSSSSWKSNNSNGLVIIPEPQKASSSHRSSSSSSYSNELRGENSRSMRQAAELKTSQPVFPGQPPPLARVDHNKQNYSQPPPRQSSQVPQRSSSSSSSSVNRTAFPGQQPPASSSSSSAASNFREPLFQQQRPDLIIQR